MVSSGATSRVTVTCFWVLTKISIASATPAWNPVRRHTTAANRRNHDRYTSSFNFTITATASASLGSTDPRGYLKLPSTCATNLAFGSAPIVLSLMTAEARLPYVAFPLVKLSSQLYVAFILYFSESDTVGQTVDI